MKKPTKLSPGYINPGMGVYLIKILIICLASGLYAIKYFWSSIKSFFK
jgi:hypothetical protein